MTDEEDPRSLISGITERGHHLVSPSFLNGSIRNLNNRTGNPLCIFSPSPSPLNVSIRGPNYRGETDPPITPNHKGENPFIIPQKQKTKGRNKKLKTEKTTEEEKIFLTIRELCSLITPKKQKQTAYGVRLKSTTD